MSQPLIGIAGNSPEWNRKIVSQLVFIREHLRYPLDLKNVTPILLMLPAIGALALLPLFITSNSNRSSRWLIPVVMLAICCAALLAMFRYLQTLRFTAVTSGKTLGENIILVEQFLTAGHFAFARHPEAPEVYQIISRSISALQGEREVVVFIADHRRILINSHFTRNRLKAQVGAPHHKEMARMLTAWLQLADRTKSTGLQTF